MAAQQKERWVLVVDDDPDVRELIVEDLVDQFDGTLRIVEAADGVQATGKLENQGFDCIITDLKMPKRDGDQFIEWVRESRLNKFSPIVVVSGAATSDLVAKYPNVHVIDKPIDFKLFGQTIKTQLKLGRLDKRISADLFNGLMDGTRRYLGKMLDAIPQVLPPEPKASGAPLTGQMHVFVSIKGPYGRCDAIFGYSPELLDKFPKSNGTQNDKIAMALTSTIVSQFISAYHMNNRQFPTPKLEQKVLVTPQEHPGPFSSLEKATGLVVKMTLHDHPFSLTMVNGCQSLF